jgi:hypothetical protein
MSKRAPPSIKSARKAKRQRRVADALVAFVAAQDRPVPELELADLTDDALVKIMANYLTAAELGAFYMAVRGTEGETRWTEQLFIQAWRALIVRDFSSPFPENEHAALAFNHGPSVSRQLVAVIDARPMHWSANGLYMAQACYQLGSLTQRLMLATLGYMMRRARGLWSLGELPGPTDPPDARPMLVMQGSAPFFHATHPQRTDERAKQLGHASFIARGSTARRVYASSPYGVSGARLFYALSRTERQWALDAAPFVDDNRGPAKFDLATVVPIMHNAHALIAGDATLTAMAQRLAAWVAYVQEDPETRVARPPPWVGLYPNLGSDTVNDMDQVDGERVAAALEESASAHCRYTLVPWPDAPVHVNELLAELRRKVDAETGSKRTLLITALPPRKAVWTPPGETTARALFGVVFGVELRAQLVAGGDRAVLKETWTSYLISIDPPAVYTWLGQAQPALTAEAMRQREEAGVTDPLVPTAADLFLQWAEDALGHYWDSDPLMIQGYGLGLFVTLSWPPPTTWAWPVQRRISEDRFAVPPAAMRETVDRRFAALWRSVPLRATFLVHWMDYALDPALVAGMPEAIARLIEDHRPVLRKLRDGEPPGWLFLSGGAWTCADCAHRMARPICVRVTAAGASLLCTTCTACALNSADE